MSARSVLSIIVCVMGFAVLCALGTWQVQRLMWKNTIIEKLEAQYATNPMTNRLDGGSLKGPFEKDIVLYGSVEGTMDHDRAVSIGPKIRDGVPGYVIVTPLILEDGSSLLVSRGWKETPSSLKGAVRNMRVAGLLRLPERNSFTPQNRPADNIWLHPDTAEIAAAKGLPAPSPLLLHAEKILPLPDDETAMDAERWLPRNAHLSYAVFWYVMALAYAGVFILFGFTRRREMSGP